MEYFLLIMSFCLLIIGILGSFLPILPGPPISWVGLLLLYLTKGIEINYWVLGVTLFIALFVVVLDYIIPAKGTKRFGGSKYGVIGTTVGLLVGLLSPIPFGIIIGAFVGALIGEYIGGKNINEGIKPAIGSLIGIITSSIIKFITGFAFLIIYIRIISTNWALLF